MMKVDGMVYTYNLVHWFKILYETTEAIHDFSLTSCEPFDSNWGWKKLFFVVFWDFLLIEQNEAFVIIDYKNI